MPKFAKTAPGFWFAKFPNIQFDGFRKNSWQKI